MNAEQQTTFEVLKVGEPDAPRWQIVARWYDEQQRRCTRFIAATHEQAGDPAAAERNARMIMEALNGCAREAIK